MLKRTWILLIMILFLLNSCFKDEPKRINPLDPLYVKNGVLTGKVLDVNNNPVNHYRIYIIDEDTYSFFLVNNSKGEYLFYKKAGTYDIQVQPYSYSSNEHYVAYKYNVKINGGKTTTQNINVMQLITYPKPGEEIIDTPPNFSGRTYPGADSYWAGMYEWESNHWEYYWEWIYNSIISIQSSTITISYPDDEPALVSGNKYMIILFAYSSDSLVAYCNVIFYVQ